MQTLDFNTISLFPTIIGKCTNLPLAEKILPFAKELLSNPKTLTNAWGYKNTFKASGNKNLPQSDEYKELESFIKDVSKSFSNLLHLKSSPDNVRFFFSEMNYGDQHTQHAHANSIFSGVFYLNVPADSAPLRFHDPRHLQNFIVYDTVDPLGANNIYDFKPQTGVFLIWQSWIPHEVLKNLSEGRITAVFNIV